MLRDSFDPAVDDSLAPEAFDPQVPHLRALGLAGSAGSGEFVALLVGHREKLRAFRDDPRLPESETAILGHLDDVIALQEVVSSHDRPDERALLEVRQRIDSRIADAELEVWGRLKPHVEVLEGRPVEVSDEAGALVRIAGWWDALLSLSRARRTDLLKVRYLEEGLWPYLKDGTVWRRRPTDRDEEIYSAGQFVDLILPRLAAQVLFSMTRTWRRKSAVTASIACACPSGTTSHRWKSSGSIGFRRAFR